MCNDSYTYSTLPLLFIIKNCVKYIVFVFERLLLSLDLVSCNQNALRVVLVFNCINIRYILHELFHMKDLKLVNVKAFETKVQEYISPRDRVIILA